SLAARWAEFAWRVSETPVVAVLYRGTLSTPSLSWVGADPGKGYVNYDVIHAHIPVHRFCRVGDIRGPEVMTGLDLGEAIAKVEPVQVVLRKLGRGSRSVSGRLVRAPRKGSVIVIEFADGMHEYVTTAVKRVLRMAQ